MTHIWTPYGNAYASGSVYKFGSGSLACDGTGDYIQADDSSDWAFGSTWTIDFWARWTSLVGSGFSATANFIMAQYVNNSNFQWFGLNWSISAWYMVYAAYPSAGGVSVVSNAITKPTYGSWYHVALVRDGSTWYFFMNGVGVGTKTGAGPTPDYAAPMRIGGCPGLEGTSYKALNGYLDEFRISNVARWTSGFTVPSAAWEPDANTVVLLHFDEGASTPQFKDFEWRDHTLDPTHVFVLANRVNTPEGLWDIDEIVVGEYVAP